MSHALFPNATHTQITGGQFIIQSTVNQRSTHLQGVDRLREYCALGALLDSNERFDPPRCTAETREMLIVETLGWIYGGADSASMAWLFGGAGVGKSALAQTIAEICQRKGYLAASFFFSRTENVDRSDGIRLIPTLVFQLLEAFPDLKPHVEASINRHTGLFERSPQAHMDLLFVKPLMTLKQHAMSAKTSPASSMPPTPMSSSIQLTAPRSGRYRFSRIIGKITRGVENTSPPQYDMFNTVTHMTSFDTPMEIFDSSQPRLIVIDGLDECNGENVQIDLLRVLARAIPHLPFPLRFLITSRPEGSITRVINHDESFRGLDVRKIDLSVDTNAEDDIRRFLTKGFQEVHQTHPFRSFLDPSWPLEHLVTILVRKSSAHFVYASTAIKYIQYPRARPDERLEIILGISDPPTADKPFAQLDALYTHIFMSIDEPYRTTINHALGLMHLGGRKKSRYRIGISAAKLEGYLGIRAGEINILFEPLLSLIVLPEDRLANIKVLHASLFDFLLDETRSGSLYLDLEMAHGLLAKYWLQYIQTYIFNYPHGSTGYEFLDPLLLCRRCLRHCRQGRILDGLKDYLYFCPFLYEVVLHPQLMLQDYIKRPMYSGLNYVAVILQDFFNMIIEKNFENGLYLHSLHTAQIEKRLYSIDGDCDLGLLNDATQKPLFNGILYQGRHRVYSALLWIYMTYYGIESLHDMLHDCRSRSGSIDIEENVLSHFLVICLPYLSYESVGLCQEFSKWTGYAHGADDELLHILRQRVGEYLQRVGNDVDSNNLERCKAAWTIE